MSDHQANKRHSALQPFSRDHHTGLVTAQNILSASEKDRPMMKSAVQDFVSSWQQEIASHFDEEERLLLPFMKPEDKTRMKEDHDKLRQYAQSAINNIQDVLNKKLLMNLAQTLKNHIRWEERHLFPFLEESLTQEQLEQVEKETKIMESSRQRANK